MRSSRAESLETILLVEDEDFVREVTREVLVLAGYRVMSARNIVEAHDRFSHGQETVHLLITDFKLPGGDGCTLARELITAQPDLKAIVISGYPPAQMEPGELSQPLLGYLAKPFSTDILLGAVRGALASEPPPVAKSAAAS